MRIGCGGGATETRKIWRKSLKSSGNLAENIYLYEIIKDNYF
jgi:hypothetical protein